MNLPDLKHANTHLASVLGIDDPLDEIGIYLCSDVQPYHATPRNSTAFAASGVDGVHYLLLHLAERRFEDSPVIRVSPMDTDAWQCVGDNLREFVELHCQWYEEFSRDSAARSECSQAELDDALRVIAALRAHFHLVTRPDREPRCEALSALHIPSMDLNPE